MCFPTYRQQGLLIARDYPLVEMMNQIYSNKGDKLKGRQLPIMYSDREKGFFSISGNLATQYPQAVGWAMASAIKGDSRIAAGWIGDGATAEGDFHNARDLRRRLPRAGDPQRRQQPVGDLELLAASPAASSPPSRRARSAMALPASGSTAMTRSPSMPRPAGRPTGRAPISGPTLIELFTYRAEGHSTSDDPTAYRPEGRRRRLAARRSDRAAEAASDRPRRMGRGAPRGAGGRSSARRSAPRRRKRRSRARSATAITTTSIRCSRTCSRTCPGTSPSSATPPRPREARLMTGDEHDRGAERRP